MELVKSTELTKRNYKIISAIIALLVSISRYGRISADSYFMAVQGKDILNGGWHTANDIFSIHSEGVFYHQKWLTCILTYLIMDKWGNVGLNIATSVIIFAIALILLALVYKLGDNKEITLWLWSGILSIVFSNSTLRPQLFSTLIMAIEVYILEMYIREKLKARYVCLLLFLCSIITMWFHSTMWVLCILVVGPYLFNIQTPYGEKKKYNITTIIVSLMLMCFGSILQPNGVSQYSYMLVCLKGVTEEYQSEVPELESLSLFTPTGTIVITTIVLYIMATTAKKKVFVPHILIIAGLGILTFKSNRIFFIYGIIYGIIFVASGWEKNTATKIPLRKYLMCPSAIFLITLIVTIISIPVKKAYGEDLTGKYMYNEDILLDLQEYDNRDGLKIYSSSPEIGSFGMTLGMKPYFDCRFEVYDDAINKNKNVIKEQHEFLKNLEENKGQEVKYIQQMQREYNFDYWILFKLPKANDTCAEVLEADNGEHSEKICSNAVFVVYKVFE